MILKIPIGGIRAPLCWRQVRCAYRRLLAAMLCGLSAVAAQGAPPKGPQPALRIPLAPLGYQSPPQPWLLMRSTLALNFVDNAHILLTYNSRSLLRRIPDDPPEDNDQDVVALLLEAPEAGGPEAAKVVASTEWRLHDHGQYLWPLGHGRFLLREGLQIRLLAPLDHLRAADPLGSRALMNLPNSPVSLQISPDGKLMVLQMENRPPDVRETVSADPGPSQMQVDSRVIEKTYDIQFVEMNSDAMLAEQVESIILGEQRAAYPLDIPILLSGYLDTMEVAPDRWHVAFGPAVANGKRKDLFNVVSTCRPALQFLSEEEFLLASCQRDQGKYSQGGYTLDGKELWRYDFPEPDGGETLRLAEDARRFALGRILTAYPLSLGQALSSAVAIGQDIRVYDARSGDQVFRIDALPMQTDGRNYALSPDGLRLAVVEDGNIDVFNLPPVKAGRPLK